MIIEPSLDKLLERVENRYSLVIATAKRARQLTEKETNQTEKPVIDAVHEIYEGTVAVALDEGMPNEQPEDNEEPQAE